MLENTKIVNESEIPKEQILRHVIDEICKLNKIYYSMEMTPKSGIQLDFNEFSKKPLFLALTWIKDDNLKCGLSVGDSPIVSIGKLVKNCHVVHHLSCYNLSEGKLDEFLGEDSVKNICVVRGGEFFEHFHGEVTNSQ